MRSIKKTTPDQNITKDPKHKLSDTPRSPGADFTNTFAALSTGSYEQDAWQSRWQTRLAKQPQSRGEVEQLMRRSNPAFIPRNHKVEEALAAATGGDLNPDTEVERGIVWR